MKLRHHQGEVFEGNDGPPVIREVCSSTWAIDEARLQGYDFGFKVFKLVMQGYFPEVEGETKSLVTHKATPKEIVREVDHRRERLRKALRLIDFVLLFSKK